ncbi:hypothetical protein K431DRAFT_284911 [Polychaeton citri CBS 116435]|uniref:Major facilitator superfamily (MFS) profile domain-containing protein n=1 Tax=Polychaeton citri CBS 116435 TaxID=1314669 RepID=A0A9P4Q821_9PEZI|nr:hypothetical protein K431DRAFT_284911 [Polychaeton citri CBS 116435]
MTESSNSSCDRSSFLSTPASAQQPGHHSHGSVREDTRREAHRTSASFDIDHSDRVHCAPPTELNEVSCAQGDCGFSSHRDTCDQGRPLLSDQDDGIGGQSSPSPRQTSHDITMATLGKVRAYWLGVVVCIGGFLFGYDSGIIGGVLTLKSYSTDFRYDPKTDKTRVQSLSVSLQQLGAFVACFLIWPITHRFGRRLSIAASSLIFCIGVVIQVINTHSLAAFYVARVIAGLGLGASSVVVPMFSSEMSPKEIRGQIGSFYQLMFTIGIFVSYWVDYGVAKDIKPSSKQWQIPIGLQLVPAGLLGLGMLTLKESTRWLTAKGRHEEAWRSLTWIRADEGESTRLEMEEIRNGVLMEERATEGFHLMEMVYPENRRRTFTASAIFIAQQATGATAFAYFGPQYFQQLVGKSGNRDLLLTAIFGAVKVAACLLFVLFVADNVGRKKILIGGALFMAACQITTAAVNKTHPPDPNNPGTVTSAGIATIALIYLFVIAYNFSWGPLPWPYVSELFPARIREPGIGIGVASQWLFNFVFSLTTPYMIKNMGWGTFLLWGLFDVIIALGCWWQLQETQGLSLEQIAVGNALKHHKGDEEEVARTSDFGSDLAKGHTREREIGSDASS